MTVTFMKTTNKDGVNLAKCATPEADPEWWFETSLALLAVEICSSCPLMNECAKFALEERIPHGVWGGLTETQRAEMLRIKHNQQRRRQALVQRSKAVN